MSKSHTIRPQLAFSHLEGLCLRGVSLSLSLSKPLSLNFPFLLPSPFLPVQIHVQPVLLPACRKPLQVREAAKRVCPAAKQYLDPFQFNFIIQVGG